MGSGREYIDNALLLFLLSFFIVGRTLPEKDFHCLV